MNFKLFIESTIPNLVDNYEVTLKAMAEVEGLDMFGKADEKTVSSWLNRQSEDSHYTAQGIMSRINQISASSKETHVGTIYGAGGINRWNVYLDGTVVFSKSHATSDYAVKRAIELGFAIK